MKRLIGYLKFIYGVYLALGNFFIFKPALFVKKLFWYIQKLRSFKKIKNNSAIESFSYFLCLNDNLDHTPVDPVYFFQDSWAAGKVFELKPEHHFDIGSSAKTIGILSQFVPVTMIDIRKLEVELPGLEFKEGTILNIPLENNSIESLSALCVVEHIGLGRYGDPLDDFGSEKAIAEMKRVVRTGGHIIFSVPVDKENKVYFNAHRAFTRDYIIDQFQGFNLKEEKYQYGLKLYDSYNRAKGFGTGLFLFEKE